MNTILPIRICPWSTTGSASGGGIGPLEDGTDEKKKEEKEEEEKEVDETEQKSKEQSQESQKEDTTGLLEQYLADTLIPRYGVMSAEPWQLAGNLSIWSRGG